MTALKGLWNECIWNKTRTEVASNIASCRLINDQYIILHTCKPGHKGYIKPKCFSQLECKQMTLHTLVRYKVQHKSLVKCTSLTGGQQGVCSSPLWGRSVPGRNTIPARLKLSLRFMLRKLESPVHLFKVVSGIAAVCCRPAIGTRLTYHWISVITHLGCCCWSSGRLSISVVMSHNHFLLFHECYL